MAILDLAPNSIAPPLNLSEISERFSPPQKTLK